MGPWLRSLAFVAALAAMVAPAQPARVLAILPFNGYSHYTMFEPLLKELAARGHHVTELSPFDNEKPANNYRWISIAGAMTSATRGSFKPTEYKLNSFLKNMMLVGRINDEMCEQTLPHPNVQALIKSDESFDLIISEVFGSDCLLGFVHKFPAPMVSMSTHVLAPWAIDRLAMPSDLSYVPSIFNGNHDKMSYWERLTNSLHHMAAVLFYEYKERHRTALARKYFGEDMPSLTELARNTSLMLVNTNVALQSARPSVPAVVEVGGMALKKPKPLPENLQKYLDSSTNGVVYFSMGSLLRGAAHSNETTQSMLTVFSKLKENVLWKYEDSVAPPGLPSNVRLEPWLPQADLLRHPNVRLFISHGGLGGTLESASAGKPVLAIPMFGDQMNNAASMINRGMAVQMEYDDLGNPAKFEQYIRTILDNPSFMENAKRVSAAFHDKPMTPLETAVWWTEFVIRHKGAYFLQTQATRMSWLQRANVDVVLTFVLAPVALVAAILALCCCRRRDVKTKKNKKD